MKTFLIITLILFCLLLTVRSKAQIIADTARIDTIQLQYGVNMDTAMRQKDISSWRDSLDILATPEAKIAMLTNSINSSGPSGRKYEERAYIRAESGDHRGALEEL